MANVVEGMPELKRKLAQLDRKTQGKVLRKVLKDATNRPYAIIKASAPVGSEPHYTYQGRLVAPGFLSRNVNRKSRHRKGVSYVDIGVAAEAFYGVVFLDEGITVTQRKGRGIKSYTIEGKHWFRDNWDKESSRTIAAALRNINKGIRRALK